MEWPGSTKGWVGAEVIPEIRSAHFAVSITAAVASVERALLLGLVRLSPSLSLIPSDQWLMDAVRAKNTRPPSNRWAPEISSPLAGLNLLSNFSFQLEVFIASQTGFLKKREIEWALLAIIVLEDYVYVVSEGKVNLQYFVMINIRLWGILGLHWFSYFPLKDMTVVTI